MGRITRVTLSPVPDGTTTTFSTGIPYTTVLAVFSNGQAFAPGPGDDEFSLTSPSAGTLTFNFGLPARTDTLTSQPANAYALIEDTSEAAVAGVVSMIAPPFNDDGDVEYTIGSDLPFAINWLNADCTQKNITGWQTFFGVKKSFEETLPLLIGKRSTVSAQISIDNASIGLTTCYLVNTDALALDPGNYECDSWGIDPSGKRHQGFRKKFILHGRAVQIEDLT